MSSNNVVDISQFSAKRAIKALGIESLESYDKLSASIDSYLIGAVSPAAFVIFRMIFSMTVQRKRLQNSLTYDEIQHGVFVDGKFVQSGTGLTRPTISAKIEELEKAGLVKISKVRNKTIFPYSVYEIDFKNMKELVMTRIPKSKLSSKKTLPDGPVKKFNSPYIINNIYKNNISTKVDRRSGARTAKTFDSIAEATGAVKERTAARRVTESNKQKARPTQLTIRGVKAAWEEAMLKYYPNVPAVALSPKAFAIFKNKIRPVITTSSLHEFFDWLCQNWQSLRMAKFGWLKDKGKDVAKAPSLPELMQYWKIFVMAYAEHKTGAALETKKTTRTAEDETDRELRRTKSELARERRERKELEDRLRIANQIAAKPAAPERTRIRRTLTERRAATERQYNGQDDDIPAWGHGEE